jgi:DNA repair protein RecO (recombination protein O)
MPLIADAAIALRRIDYSETSQILVLFTREHGKVRAIAKGVKRSTRKQFAPGVDLLDVGAVGLSVRPGSRDALATLTEWKQTACFPGLRERLPRLHAALYTAEATVMLTEDYDPHPGLHDALLATLDALSTADDVFESLVAYQSVLLRSAGAMPRLDACVACGRSPNLTHFSAWQGGMLCPTCATRARERRPVRPETLASLRDPTRSAISEGAFALLNYHLSHLAGREPRLAATLLSPARRPRGHAAAAHVDPDQPPAPGES